MTQQPDLAGPPVRHRHRGGVDHGRDAPAPATARLLAAHMLAGVLIQGSWYAVSAMMPVLARKRFDATDWQTVMVTAAMPTLMLVSIFWGDLLRRWSIRTFLLVHWAASMIPLACGAFAQNFWQLLACHVLAAAGASGWSPVAGDLLKGFYQDHVRGRALGLINSAMFAGWMIMSFAIGKGLDYDENIFRLYLPAAAVLYLCGTLILCRLAARTDLDADRQPLSFSGRGAGVRVATQASAHGPTPLNPPLSRGEVTHTHAPSHPPLLRGDKGGSCISPLPLKEESGMRAIGRGDSPDPETQAVGAVPPAHAGTPLPLRPVSHEAPLGLRRLLDPIIHARAILRADRAFYRYEAAFMTYGIGWMICTALLPVLATDRLHMKYTEFAGSTQVIYTLCMLVTTYPMGWIMDRIGAVRTSGLSFVLLAIYPIGLIFSFTVPAVAITTVIYGTAMAGVNIGWMLGPVALAPNKGAVAQYVAIHATLVGIRGTVGQFVGMLVYSLTGSFTWSYSIAAITFLWAAWQMWQLHGRLPSRAERSSPSPGGRG